MISIVIPCYNAARWVDEAVKSCIGQTYAPIEIIVVNDGSTDNSLEVLHGYGERITVLDVPNGGAARARNLGYQRSRGEYIQFLDADDYLTLDKIERQIAFLESSGADAVYGDWRHITHFADGRAELDPIESAGVHADLLKSNLEGWWVPPYTLLYRREAVARTGGWDQNAGPADDRDFFLSLLLSGARVEYEPQLTGIYRRYGRVTLSTSSTEKWVRGHLYTLEKAESKLEEQGIRDAYRGALANAYYNIAHGAFDVNRALHKSLLHKVQELDAGFVPSKPPYYQWIRRTFGLEAAEEAAGLKRRLLGQKAEF